MASARLTTLLAALLLAVSGGAWASKGSAPKPLLVVAGASGKTGQQVMVAAAKSGWRVRALTSDLKRARSDVGTAFRLAEWREVDLLDTAALATALQGAQHVVSAIGARSFEGPRSPQFVDFQGNVNLVDAARKAGARHFVLISSSRAGTHADQTKSEMFGHSRFWKTRAEEHLRVSGLPYTIIGPGGLTDEPPRQQGLRVLAREVYEATDVSRADVARVALEALGNPAANGKSFALINVRGAAVEGWRSELAALAPDRPAAAALDSLSAFAWMAGHWRSDGADGYTTEEVWLAPAGAMMLGMNRAVSNKSGRAFFENMRLEVRPSSRVFYMATPQGQPPADFEMTHVSSERASFINLRSEFPQSIVYSRVGTELHARVDGVDDGKIRSLTYRFLPYRAP